MLRRMMAAAAVLVLLTAADAPPRLTDVDAATAFGALEGVRHLSLSPDGRRVAIVAPGVGQSAILMIADAGDGAKPKSILTTSGDPERLRWCRWVSNDRLACQVDGVVREPGYLLHFTRMFAVNIDGSNIRQISKQENRYSRGYQLGGGNVIDWMPEEDGVVLMTRVQLADAHLGSRIGTDKEGLQVDRIDTRTLATRIVEQPRLLATDYISDGRGNVRIKGEKKVSGADYDKGVTAYSYRLPGSRDWQPLGDYDYSSGVGFDPWAVDHDANLAYGFRNKGGRLALVRVALDVTRKEEVVFERPDVDVDDLVRIGRRNRVVGVSFATDRRQVVYFDPDIAKLAASLGKALPQQPLVRIVDSNMDESKLLIWAGSDDDPGLYYTFDRTARQLAIFKPVRPELEGIKLANVKAITFPASDGTMIPGYLTLPPGKEEAKALPAIVMPHGGPASRDEWGFDWLAQYFAARGYAVLQPEFRGSSGYGDAWFEKNGFQSWKIAIGDVLDSGRWLVSQKIADPAKLAIVGWSYGGYAALQSAVVDPALFKAVVAIAPVTDLDMLKKEAEGWSDRDLVNREIGSGPHIREGSPAQNAAKIRAPVMMFHGGLDRNVEIGESRFMDARLTASGVPHELVTWEKLDHQLEDSAVRAEMLRRSDAFIRKATGM